MAWVGYYQLNGTEFINVARTSAYAYNAGVSWFRGCDNNPALPRVLGDPDYSSPLQDEAPWTDPDDPNTFGFYGVYPLEVSGIEDGTGSASVTESTLDGGVVGVRRYGTKTIVFNVALLGQDECAVEAGFRWLKRVIAGDPCDNRADSNCVGADLCYLSCDPCIDPDCLTPGRDATADALARLNYCVNPAAESTTTVLRGISIYSQDVSRVSPSPIDHPGASVTPYATAVLADSPRMFIRFDETTGPCADSSGNGRTFTDFGAGGVRGVLGLVTGDANKAFGPNQVSFSKHAYRSNGAEFNPAPTVSYEITVRPTTRATARNYYIIIGRGSNTANPMQIRLAQISGDTYRVESHWFAGSQRLIQGTFTFDITTSPKLNIILTYDGTTLRQYVNGVLDGQIDSTAPTLYGGGFFTIGTWDQADYTYPFQGTIDEFAVYPGALSQARVTAHNNSLNATTGFTDHAWQTFRENTDLTEPTVSMVRTEGTIPLTPGDTATFGATLMTNVPDRLTDLSIVWVNGAGANIGSAVISSAVRLEESAPTRVVGHAPAAPTGTVGAYAIFSTYADGGDAFANEQVFYDYLTWEVGDTDGSYFDGNSLPSSADMEIRWAGTPDNSASQMIVKGNPASEPPDFSDCLSRYLRSLRKVVVTTGPNLTAKRTATDGSAIWTATFTAVAGNPFEYSTERPVIEGFMDPAHPIPYIGGVVPEGGSFDLTANEVTEEEDCVVATYQPIIDTTCAFAPMAPPAPPSIDLSCYGFVENFYRRQFILPPSYVPLWDDVVPKIEVHSPKDAELRNLRLRFYPDYMGTGDTTIDPCNYCGDLVVSYLPPNTTLVIDGSDRTTYSMIAGGARQRADHLIFSTDGSPFEWPELTCGLGYIVTVDLPQVQALPVVDLSLYARAV
jgi:hypothetical protein